jgi:hypothetical protein
MQIPQYSCITHLTDIRTNMEQIRISYLSNGLDTNITISASMDIDWFTCLIDNYKAIKLGKTTLILVQWLVRHCTFMQPSWVICMYVWQYCYIKQRFSPWWYSDFDHLYNVLLIVLEAAIYSSLFHISQGFQFFYFVC